MAAESAGNANAVHWGGASGGYDVGLLQINQYWWLEAPGAGGTPPCGAATNLAYAKDVYAASGGTWAQWSACTKCGCCDSA